MCLAQEHNTVTPVRIEPATPPPQVKHSSIEPLLSHLMLVIDTLNKYRISSCKLLTTVESMRKDLASKTIKHSTLSGYGCCQ